MGLIYLIIVGAILLFTVNLASPTAVFAQNKNARNYDSLRAFGVVQKRFIAVEAMGITFVLILLCIGRPDDMPDYQMYRMIYGWGASGNLKKDMEITFTFLVRTAPTFIIFIGVYAIISVSAHVYAIFRNSPNIWLSLLIYLSLYFVLHDMVQIRAAVATGILLISLRYMVERTPLVYFGLVALAILFHYSALIFIPMYFIPYKHINKWVWSGVLIVSLAFGLLNMHFGYIAKFIPVEIIQSYVYAYMGSHQHVGIEVGVSNIVKIIIGVILIFNLETIRKRYPYAVPVMMFYIFSQMSYVLFADLAVLQTRMGELFGVFEIFALAMFPLISRKYYIFLCIVPIALAMTRFGIALNLIGDILN